MMTQKQVIDILQEYVIELKKIYHEKLVVVSLFGSYARGDYHEDSDIDVMLILDIPEKNIKEYNHQLFTLTYQFNLKYDIAIEPMTVNVTCFRKWMTVHPFYKNIREEGIVLYEPKEAACGGLF